MDSDNELAFTRFVKEVEPLLSHAFFAAYGRDVGADVTSDALGYAWAHWSRVGSLDNPAGYLYRVGQSKARWYRRVPPRLPSPNSVRIPRHEPSLARALADLSKNQRIVMILVYAEQWTEVEVAALLGKSRSTVRTHLDRGLHKLRVALKEEPGD